MTSGYAATHAHLGPRQYDQIKEMLYEVSRIDLKDSKQNLVEARLAKRVRSLGLPDFDAYIDLVRRDGSRQELAFMVDSLTTNKTSFFRESKHFDYLRERLLPSLKGGGELKIWCAACSSGEEPYSLSILLREEWPDADRQGVRILATDISDTALAAAKAAVYSENQLQDVPPPLRKKYFSVTGPQERPYAVGPEARRLVQFAALNLMGHWPMSGPFQVIFCRNVMIYFDRPTQETLVGRFHQLLSPGGHLFTSHSESMTGVSHSYQYVQPGVYTR